MAHAFSVPDEEAAKLLWLVAAASGVQHLKITVGGGADVEFEAHGKHATGAHTACRYLASLGGAAEQLLGESPEQQAKIAEWLSFQHTALGSNGLMDARLAELDSALAARTYIAGGSRPSLADLVLYAAVAPAAAAFPVAQHGHFCNLLRWYDLLHHTADAQRLFPAATFVRPRYVAPPPPPPAEPKAAKGGADAGAAASTKGAAGPAAAAGKKGGDKEAAVAAAPAPAAAPEAGGKKEKKAKKDKGAEPATPAASGEAAGGKKGGEGASADSDCTVDLLDIRVGQIVKVGRHPNADALYLEEIDLGEGQPRQVVSGLVKFVPEDQMAGRRVVVVCNLKPAKMRDVMSYGMVLCASNEEHTSVDPITPPEGVPVGERITFEGFAKEPEAQLNPKKKQFEKMAPELRVDASGVCAYRGIPMMTSKGAVTATITNSWIK